MPTRGKTKTKGLVIRKGDWCCTCTHINIARRLKCQLCEGPKKCGTILDKTNLKCCQRRKGKKKGQVSKPSPTNLYEKLRAWSERNPLGINVNVVLHDKSWVDSLLECVGPTSGAHIHTNTSKWKFFKLNLSAGITDIGEWLTVSAATRLNLASVAEICLSAALLEVAEYTDCSRVTKDNGVTWTLPCGEAAEICSLIFQPKGSGKQRIHQDGHKRYCLPGAEDMYYNSFFLNVILPLRGDDIPTLFRGNDQKLIASERCYENQMRVFNGGSWHAGAANNSEQDVWKLFLGLVPANHASAGEFPIFADGGKSLAKEKGRYVLLADTR